MAYKLSKKEREFRELISKLAHTTWNNRRTSSGEPKVCWWTQKLMNKWSTSCFVLLLLLLILLILILIACSVSVFLLPVGNNVLATSNLWPRLMRSNWYPTGWINLSHFLGSNNYTNFLRPLANFCLLCVSVQKRQVRHDVVVLFAAAVTVTVENEPAPSNCWPNKEWCLCWSPLSGYIIATSCKVAGLMGIKSSSLWPCHWTWLLRALKLVHSAPEKRLSSGTD